MDEVERPETDEVEEAPAIQFNFTPVAVIPKRKYRKGSKYDPILEAFLKSPDKLSEISVKGKDANYLRTQLNKRIEATKKYSKITVSVTNNIAYLEKK